MTKKIPGSPFTRARKLLGLGSSVLAKEVKGRLAEKFSQVKNLDSRIGQAEDIVRTLGELKGAAMKAGQLLSLEFSDFLPPEVIAVLRQLHDQSVGYSGEEMAAFAETELGAARFARLENFSPEPVAAASIGQVHRATLAGRPVVVKIQYPGIADSIDHDITIVKKLADAVLRLNGKTINLEPFYLELKQGLKDEADYLREAGALKHYHTLFQGEHFTVPEVIPEFSTARVLTMSEVQGTRLSDWIARNKHDEGQRAWIGRLILRLLIDEFFVHGIVQTDPNFGNFLVDEAGKKLVLLDCGAVRTYERDFRRNIRELARTAMEFETTPVVEAMIRQGMLHADESVEVKTLLAEIVIDVMALFTKEMQPVHFGDTEFLNDLRRRVFDIVRLVKHSGPARQVIFLNRKLGGMFHLLKEMQVVMDIWSYWQEVDRLDLG
jgi:aarF domain-containing kinase